ncbi:MAG: hypothetical protein HS129_05000 [Leptospiraceae bacterium]|nr:hypothetical protein [Leptospiraceae bacterium]NUM41551.1 hypothetical protein [Leptospiraceae bacterium]
MKKNKEKIYESTPPTPEMKFYCDWALQFPKESLQILNDSLGKLLTFSIAMFSILIAINDKLEGFPATLYVATLISLFATMVLSFISIIPIERKVSKHMPFEIKKSIEELYKSKKRYLFSIFILMSLSIVMILAGVIKKFQLF